MYSPWFVAVVTLFTLLTYTGRHGLAYAAAADDAPTAWPVQQFVSRPDLRPPVFEYNRTGESDPGYIFVAPIVDGPTSGYIMTEDGHLIYATPASTYAPRNLKPWKLWDKDVLVYNELQYWNGDLVVSYGSVVIMDDTYTVLYNVMLQDRDLNPQFPGEYISYMDTYEALITVDNTLIVVAGNATPWDLSPVGGPSDGWLRDSVVYELDIETNEILYRWRASDDVPIRWSKAPLGGEYGDGTSAAQAWDAFHVNSADSFEGGLMVSLRNCWAGVYVRKSTGRMAWHIEGSGGGNLSLDARGAFSWQHDMRLETDDTTGGIILHMHNNQNSKRGVKDKPTNGLVLDLDLKNMRAATRQTLENAERPAYAWNSGSMTWSPHSHAFLSYGSESRMQEFDRDGNSVYELQYGAPGIGFSYRGYKTRWRGFPAESPTAVACRQDGNVYVFMSWNGATEVARWDVYAYAVANGDEAAGFVEFPVARVARTGFETRAVFKSSAEAVQVEASGGGGDGNTRRSEVVKVQADCRASGIDVERAVS